MLRLNRSVQSQPRRMGWRIENQEGSEADMYIYDVIGGGLFDEGTAASDFVRELRGIDADRINVYINSPGGLIDDGLAIYNALKQHPAEIIARIDALAASAAAFVAMAADRILINRTAKMFIHDARGLAIGTSQDFATFSRELDEESNNIASIFAERAGGTTAEWRAAMVANNDFGTSYRGQEAVEAGLADEVTEETTNWQSRIGERGPSRSDAEREVSRREALAALQREGMSRRRAAAVLTNGWDSDTSDTDDDPSLALENLIDSVKGALR